MLARRSFNLGLVAAPLAATAVRAQPASTLVPGQLSEADTRTLNQHFGQHSMWVDGSRAGQRTGAVGFRPGEMTVVTMSNQHMTGITYSQNPQAGVTMITRRTNGSGTVITLPRDPAQPITRQDLAAGSNQWTSQTFAPNSPEHAAIHRRFAEQLRHQASGGPQAIYQRWQGLICDALRSPNRPPALNAEQQTMLRACGVSAPTS